MEAGPDNSAPIQRWSDGIDNFGQMKDAGQKSLARMKASGEALNAFYSAGIKGENTLIPETPKTEHRKAFLDYLQDQVMHNMARLEPANEKGTELEQLLGAKGMELYKLAVNEEANSRAFRDAVFQRSTNHYDGETWSQRLIAPFAGPSAAGKSVSQPALIAGMGQHMPKSGANNGNTVVSVDGGVEREMSQIRGMVLQVALAKGFKGVTDLDKNKAKVSIKKLVEEAAIATPGLNIVIPKTYTNEALNYVKGTVGKSDFKKYDAVDGGQAVVGFGIVEAEHANVAKNGDSRAWNGTNFTEADIKMNGKLPCESKAYHDHYKAGTNLSEAAKNNYQSLHQADTKPRICFTVKSDFTFIKPDATAECGWSLASKSDSWNKDMVGMLQRDFDKFSNDYSKYVNNIKSQITTTHSSVIQLEAQIEDLNKKIKSLAPGSIELLTASDELKVAVSNLDNESNKMKTLFNVITSKSPDAVLKHWQKANGWSPPQTNIVVTAPKQPPAPMPEKTVGFNETANIAYDANSSPSPSIDKLSSQPEGLYFNSRRNSFKNTNRLGAENQTSPNISNSDAPTPNTEQSEPQVKFNVDSLPSRPSAQQSPGSLHFAFNNIKEKSRSSSFIVKKPDQDPTKSPHEPRRSSIVKK